MEQLVDEFRHLQNKHRSGREGSRQRTLHARLEETTRQFEALLNRWVVAGPLRDAWLEHLHHGAEPPQEPVPLAPPLFVGRSDLGSELVIRQEKAARALILDGNCVHRESGQLPLVVDGGRRGFRLDGRHWFRETFNVSRPAIDALLAWVRAPRRAAPWQWAQELLADGLIDGDFSLQPRGRRLVERYASG